MLPSHIRTPRLTLRPLAEPDRAEFIRVQELSRDHFAPWVPDRPQGQTDAQFFEESVARGAEGLVKETDLRLAGFLDDGRLAAFVSLGQIVRRAFENAYLGWGVPADCLGRGLATEAVGGMLDLAFAPAPLGVGLHRVQANIIPRNVRSIRVAEKCGLRREGLAQRYLRIAGAWEDHLMFAKLADEHPPAPVTPEERSSPP